MAERTNCGVSREDFLKVASEAFDRFEETGLDMVVMLNDQVSMIVATGETMLAVLESASDDLALTMADTLHVGGQGRVN